MSCCGWVMKGPNALGVGVDKRVKCPAVVGCNERVKCPGDRS